MDSKIKEIVDEIFIEQPHSEEIDRAKNAVYAAFLLEYERLTQEYTKIQAVGILVSRYGTLMEAGKLAGYSEAEISVWSEKKDVTSRKELVRMFRKLHLVACVTAVCLVFTLVSVFDFILFQEIIWLVSICLFLVPAVLARCYLYIRGRRYRYREIWMDFQAREYLEKQSDCDVKRMFHSICAAIAGFFFMLFMIVISVWKIGLTSQEIISSVMSNITVIELVLFLLIKNILYSRLSVGGLEPARRKAVFFYKLLLIAASFGYWGISTAVVFALSRWEGNIFNVFFVLLFLYFALCGLADLTVRKKVVFQNIRLNRKRIVAWTVCGTFLIAYRVMQMDTYILQPYISTVQRVEVPQNEITYEEQTGVYTITTDRDEFKILQLTDIHLGGSAASFSKDYKALRACYRLIEYTKPDLVVITGDLVFPLGVMSFSLNNTAPIIEFASFMRNIGVPWVFTYGNHDTEAMANGSVEEIQELYQSLSYRTSQNFLYPYVQPDITGRNNQLLEIRGADGDLMQAIFLLDSNDYISGVINQYDYIHDDEVAWYRAEVERLTEQEGRLVSSMIFFHMPLQEYRTAYELYAAGSSEVAYFFGENEEKMIDKVCCSDYPSKLFETAKELGSTKAMFCGHDHYNNLSVEYEGIRLTYGMSIDYLAMPGIEWDTDQRGGTLITIRGTSEYDVEQIKLTDLE